MEKQVIIGLLNDILTNKGYIKKGNNWIKVDHYISKVINLQKSSYSNLYYLNYGFIINDLDSSELIPHYGGRLLMPFTNKYTMEQIFMLDKISPEEDLLNFENSISDADRKIKIKKILEYFIHLKMDKINSYENLRSMIEQEKIMQIHQCGIVTDHVSIFLKITD